MKKIRGAVSNSKHALAGTTAIGVSLFLASSSWAQCVPNPTVSGGTTNCTGTVTAGLTVGTTNTTVNIASGATLSASGTAALNINAPASFVGNYERVNVSGQVLGVGSSGITLFNGAVTGNSFFGPTANLILTVAAGGSVGGATGVLLDRSPGNTNGVAVASVDNSGTISGTSGFALQVGSAGSGAFSTIVNRSSGTIGAIAGQIDVLTNAGTIDGGNNSAINVGSSSSITFNGAWDNTGSIISNSSIATIANASALINGNLVIGGNAITNAGSIANTGTGAAISGSSLGVTNKGGGTISATNGPALFSTGGIVLANTGTIVGDIVASSGNSVIDTNAGVITGNVMLGSGDDVLVARYNGTPTLATGISGTIDGGSGKNSVRIIAAQDITINTSVQLPTRFQQLQLAPAAGTTMILDNGFVAPGTIVLGGNSNSPGGNLTNKADLIFTGQAFTSQTYSGLNSFINQGSIQATSGTTSALVLDGIINFSNSGSINVTGDAINTSSTGRYSNSGTIVATGTAFSGFNNSFQNNGTVRSTGGTAVRLTGSQGYSATNSGQIEGAVAGVNTSINLNNTGTIVATNSSGTAVRLDGYGSLVNASGGVVGNGNGGTAVSGLIFNSTVVNAGTINGNVALTGSNQGYISLSGGILNGNLALGSGSLLLTDLNNAGPGQYAGISGTVTAGANSTLKFRVGSDATAILPSDRSFATVGYELASGTTLSLTAPGGRTQAFQFAGSGTVNLNADLVATTAPAIQSTSLTSYPGGPSSFTSQLTINTAGNISLDRIENNYVSRAIALNDNDSLINSGTISVINRFPSSPFIAAVLGGKSVTNSGTIVVDGATGVFGVPTVINSGTISQITNGSASQGIVGAVTVSNSGTISVGGTAVQLGAGGTPTLTNSGTIASTSGAAIIGGSSTRIDNSGVIAGGGATAVQLGSNSTVTLRTGSDVRGSIDGGSGTNRATLIGTATSATASQTVAAFKSFATLAVSSGYWTALATANSNFASGVTIASGATLENANAANGLSGATAATIVNNGTLVVRSSSASAGSTFGTTKVTGSGNVVFTGAGNVLLDGVNSLGHSGGTTITGGSVVTLTGSQGGGYATSPGGTFQIGNGGTFGNFTGDLTDNGTFVLNRSDDFTIVGAIDGSGFINKLGQGTVTFTGPFTFTGVTTIQGGSIRFGSPMPTTNKLDLEGTGRIDLSGQNQTVAALSGGSTTASVNIAGGSLTVNQSDDTSFAGNITGNGSVTKTGTGRLNLVGTNNYTGPTTLSGGTLSINGVIVSPTTVISGGILGGNGTIAAPVTIAAGGIVSPGNSIGTLNINGNLTLNAGSIYQVEANAAGQADRINVTGTAALAGTVRVLPAAGTYPNLNTYTILTATGGISGTFSSVTSSLAFLTPSLDYSANAVTLSLRRNDADFVTGAAFANQRSVAAAIQSRGFGNAIYNYVLTQDSAGAQAAFVSLSGEIHASVPTILLAEGEEAARIVRDRSSFQGEGFGIWAQGLYGQINSGARNGIAATETDRRGGIAGIDYGHEGLRAGFAGGNLHSDVGAVGRASHADIASKIATAYVGLSRGALTVNGGISYSWHDVRTRRTISMGTLGGLTTAKYDANTLQFFGQASYGLVVGVATFAPFLSYSHVRTHRDGFAEVGTIAALTVTESTRTVDVVNVGLKLSGTAPMRDATLLPKLAVSYGHSWGNTLGIERANFADNGLGFSVIGAGTGENSLRIEVGADILIGHGFRIGGNAFGQRSGSLGEHGVRGSLSYVF